jgi:hypothetical protein
MALIRDGWGDPAARSVRIPIVMAFVYFPIARSAAIKTVDRPAGGLTMAGQTAAEPQPKFPGGWR